MDRRLPTLLLLLAFLAVSAPAQFRPLRFEQFTIGDGISNNSVNAILQANDGFLWIGTKDGLNRYDGESFRCFKRDPASPSSLPDNYVQSLLEATDGTLYVGTWGGGLCVYDGREGTFRRIDADGRADDYVQCLHQDSRGRIWYGTPNGGLNMIDPGTQARISYSAAPGSAGPFPTSNILCITGGANDNLWIGTGDAGVVKFNTADGSFIRYHSRPHLLNHRTPDAVASIWTETDSTILAGTLHGVDRLDLRTGLWTHDPFFHDSDRVVVDVGPTQVLGDRSGRLWVGTYEYLGLYMIENPGSAGRRIVRLRRENDNPTSLVSNRIRCLYEDRYRNLWIGTEDGLCRLPVTQPFYQYRHLPLRPNSLGGRVVSSIVEDRHGILWVGLAGDGFDRVDPVTGRVMHAWNSPGAPGNLTTNDVTTIAEDRAGTVWIGTMSGGLHRYNSSTGRFTAYRHREGDSTSLCVDWVQQVLETRQGEFLVASNEGLQTFDRARGTFRTYAPAITGGAPSFPVHFAPNVLFEDSRQVLWIGTWLDGLYEYDPASGILHQYMPDANDRHAISSSKITCMFEDSRGAIWVGTHSGGMCRFDRNTGWFRQYSTLDGLGNDVVFGIQEDDRGFLWVSTMNGLAKFNPGGETFRVYDESDGLVYNQFNWRASARGSNGMLYFGGNNGFIGFHPDSIVADSTRPRVTFSSFRVFDKETPTTPLSPGVRSVTLRHDQNFFSIEFGVLDFAPAHKHEFAYMLRGVDPDWVKAGSRRIAYYTNIDEGEYDFLVRASSAEGEWAAQASMIITVLPSWWMTWWFRVLALLALLGAMIAFYKARVHRIVEIERLRLTIASDLHDEIGSNLSSISVDSQMLLQSSTLSPGERELSSDISRTARETVDALRDIVWFITPANKIGADVIFKMKETAAKLLSGMEWTFTVQPGIQFDSYDLETRRHIFLMYKETLTNILRHAGATHCTITAAKSGQRVRLTIADDGVGFNVQEVKASNGLRNLLQRARAIGAMVTITSEEGKGTQIEVDLPHIPS
jgi:ligand-binding sensor domain-containing protein